MDSEVIPLRVSMCMHAHAETHARAHTHTLFTHIHTWELIKEREHVGQLAGFLFDL